jgi:methenyltetrahydrofolate cyclohydrolase
MQTVWRVLKRFASAIVRRAGVGGQAGKESKMLIETTLEEFTDRLAAGTPTPGGGSAAALAGSLSASLLQMVCDLTTGREKYKQHEAAVLLIRRRAESLRKDLLALVDRDAEAYDAVVRARKLPKGTPSEEASRRETLGRANLFATETPLATAEACAALLGLAIELAFKGNVNALSDVGSAALLAYGSLRAAVLNVRVNLPSLVDGESASRARAKVSRLEVDAEKLREEALEAVCSGSNRP